MGRFSNAIRALLPDDVKVENQGTKKSEIQKKDVDLLSIATVFSPDFTEVRWSFSEMLERYWGWVYGCIRAIAQPVSELELKLYSHNGNDTEEVENHPVLELLAKVNSNMTFAQLIDLLETSKKLCGEAFWYLYRDGQQIKEIWPIRADYLTPIPGDYREGKFVDHYNFHIPGKEVQRIETQDIIQFKETNPESLYRGYGVIEAAIKVLNLEYYAEEWNNMFFKNAASTGAILSTEAKLNPDSIKRIKSEIEKLYQGYKKAHKTMVLDQGTTYQEAGRSQRDMEFNLMQQFVREKSLAMFRVSKTMLGMGEDVNRATAETQDYVFGKQTIRPEMSQIVDTLNEFLLPQFAGSETLFFDFEDPVPRDDATLVSKLQSLTNICMTINESRDELGLDPIGEAGDYIYMGLGQTPLKDSEGTPPPVQNDPFQAQNDETGQVGEGSEEPMKILKIKGKPVRQKLSPYAKRQIKRLKNAKPFNNYLQVKELATDVVLEIKKQKDLMSRENLEEKWKIFALDIEIFTKKLTKRLYKFFDNEEKEIREKLDKFNLENPNEKVKKDEIFNEEKYKEAMAKEVKPIIEEAYKNQADKEVERIKIEQEKAIGFSMTPAMKKSLWASILKFVGSVADTRATKIKSILEEGIEKGWSIDQFTKSIMGFYEDYSRNEAEKIARTEIIRSLNKGALDTYKHNSDVVVAKVWYTAPGSCEICTPLDGKIVALNGSFGHNDYDGNITEPPLHPNCRCTIAPVVKGSDFSKNFQLPVDMEEDAETSKVKKEMDELRFENKKLKTDLTSLLKAIE